MTQYRFNEIERKWQQHWAESGLYKVSEDPSRPKYYVLDMFPYPSGAGLHVGHPLGYIASDIVSRYKRLNGFNVLHPMGYDAFGLPAEQYAIQTGQHPAVTTANNINTFRRQLDIMGFSYDWSREVRTCDPGYYKWTQWIFGLFFTHWYDRSAGKARAISELIHHFSMYGSAGIHAACSTEMNFSAAEWNVLSQKMKDEMLNNYRLAFIDETTVNWCAEMGTVLANEEVVNDPVKGPVSERGGYPVVRKKMKQWSLRITAYADRLLEGLDRLDWSDSIREIQRNWIGRSEGAQIRFAIDGEDHRHIEIFTTRPDTIFGATFMVLAPEYEGLESLCSEEQRATVMAYADKARNRSEIDRMADTTKTGVFTGRHCINPFTNQPIQVWVSDYVLAGYGTGAIMAVPAHDDRDFEFATAFNLPVVPVIQPAGEEITMPLTAAFSAKDGVCFNSGFLNGLSVKEAIRRAIQEVETLGIGRMKVNYKLREAGFGRQRYWGEPFPVVFDGQEIPHLITELPVELPKVESYKPSGTGESPLAGVSDWVNVDLDDLILYREAEFLPSPEGRGAGGEENHLFSEPTPGYNNIKLAREQRQKETNSEQLLWRNLRGKNLGVKFRRQHPIGSFICDFVCLSHKLAIELDGEVHKHQKDYDKNRTAILNEAGFEVIRFWNDEVLTDMSGVLDRIRKKLRSLTPDPSPQAERGEENAISGRRETDTMPGWAGSSWYFLRYTDPNNQNAFAGEAALKYWNQVDLYVGGSEHATGHLLYSRFWTKFLYDLGYISWDEPFQKLVNQGMIMGEDGQKMSKRWGNVVNPDDVCANYGADTLRLYEMFLGPLTDSKPWNTNGIEGVSRFLGKFWRLFFEGEQWAVNNDAPTPEELKILHKLIKKVTWDIEHMSFNTSVPAFMVATNEQGQLKCRKKAILEPMLILLAPFAPHITEELWQQLGHTGSIHTEQWPVHDEKYLVENTFSYPISINGKTRTQIEFPLDMEQAAIETAVLADATVQKWMEGKPLKKIIVVKGRIVNVVV